MAHEKVYGICENKCKVEVYPKTQTYSKSEVDAPVTVAQNTANEAVTRLNNNIAKFKAVCTDLDTIKSEVTKDQTLAKIGSLLQDTLTVLVKLFGEDLL
jgi:hypothetical protein